MQCHGQRFMIRDLDHALVKEFCSPLQHSLNAP